MISNKHIYKNNAKKLTSQHENTTATGVFEPKLATLQMNAMSTVNSDIETIV